MSSKDMLLVEARGPVTVLTLNRPDRRNALSPALVAALGEAVVQPRDTAALVLTGAGTVFCAGGDLAPFSDDGFLGGHRGRAAFADLLGAMLRSRTPIIGAINGDALGGGFGLAAACHLLVADERARFGTPELKVGLFPMMISPLLARLLPRQVLFDCILAGRRLSATEALGFGFVNRLAPPGEAFGRGLELATEVASHSPAVVGLGLEALAHAAELPIDVALRHMHAQLSINLMLEDAGEGIAAFVGRRAPEWKGR